MSFIHIEFMINLNLSITPFYSKYPKGYDLSEGLILERYLNSIAETSEEELLTEVLLPVIPNLLQ